jgi:hypothetical protein
MTNTIRILILGGLLAGACAHDLAIADPPSSDGDTDGDTDTDADGDTDGDTDTDADGDTDGDTDADTDTDADGDTDTGSSPDPCDEVACDSDDLCLERECDGETEWCSGASGPWEWSTSAECGSTVCPADVCESYVLFHDYPATCARSCNGGDCESCTCSATQTTCYAGSGCCVAQCGATGCFTTGGACEDVCGSTTLEIGGACSGCGANGADGTCAGATSFPCGAATACDQRACGGTDYVCTNAGGSWAWRTAAACDDGDPCTYDDVCGGTGCQGTSITCTNTSCMIRTCNGTATCTETPRTSATTCGTTPCAAATCVSNVFYDYPATCTRYCSGSSDTCNTCTCTAATTTCAVGGSNQCCTVTCNATSGCGTAAGACADVCGTATVTTGRTCTGCGANNASGTCGGGTSTTCSAATNAVTRICSGTNYVCTGVAGTWAWRTAVYVSTTGSSSNTGLTPSSPKPTVAEGIVAASNSGRVVVLVAGGTYQVGSTVTMANGISLYGGYSADFSARNVSTNVTLIEDTRNNPGYDVQTVLFPGSITAETVLDGFSVKAGRAYSGNGANNNTMAVAVYASAAVVRNSRILGAAAGYNRTGVYVSACSPLIERNTISLTTGTSNNRGVFVVGDSSAVIRNNVLQVTSANYNTGIFLGYGGGVAVIRNNTVYSGGSPSSSCYDFGIGVEGTTTPIIENNILQMKSNAQNLGWAINERDTANVQTLRNNSFHNWPYNYNDLTTGAHNDVNDPSKTTQGAASTVEGNVVLDPGFVDLTNGDFHLQASSPLNIRGGGRSFSAFYTDDLEGTTRTTGVPAGATNPGASGWSIGAYERD